MQFTSEQLDEFFQRGWTSMEGVFSSSAASETAMLAVRLCQQDLESEVTSDTADQTRDGAMVPRKLDRPFLRDEAFRAFALNWQLQSLVSQLIGKPALLIVDQIFLKPPHFGSAKPYHQDNAYFQCEPPDDVITAWIALDDVDEQNGCLRYIDGSHTGGLLEHVALPDEPHNRAPAADAVDLTRESPACLRQGGVVFHHSQTLHTSHRNASDRWRRAYATHWGSADVTSSVETVRSAYYNQHAELYQQACRGVSPGSTRHQ